MPEGIVRTPALTDGFIENLNLVARHIREVDDSIFEDMQAYVDLAKAWAENPHGVEPDPEFNPGMMSSLSNAIDSYNSAQDALQSELAAAISAQESAASAIDSSGFADNSAASAAESAAQAVLAAQEAANALTSAEASELSSEESQLRKWESEAWSKTSDSFSQATTDTFVQKYTSNGDGTFSNADYIPLSNSARHWADKAQLSASGLILQGTWSFDATCTMPPTPAQVDPGLSVDGYWYIVDIVDPLCTIYSVGDWIVWSGDDKDTLPIEGDWDVISWKFGWESITDVPENVYNAVSRSGDTMTGDLLIDKSAPTLNLVKTEESNQFVRFGSDGDGFTGSGYIGFVADEPAIRITSYTGDITLVASNTNAATVESGGQISVIGSAPTDTNHLTRKDYVDNRLIDGGTYSNL